jgi:hypothetical protein
LDPLKGKGAGLARKRYLLVHTRVKDFRPKKKCEIVDTDEEENLVAPSVERSIVVAVELRSPLAQFPCIRHVEAQIFTAYKGEYVRLHSEI